MILNGSVQAVPDDQLFRSRMIINENTKTCEFTGSRDGYGFHSDVGRYNAGVYLFDNRFEDEFQFILPFGIGANGYARKSDGSRFNTEVTSRYLLEHSEPGNTLADLYRPGYQPFEDFREHRLVTLLESWRERVESGDWSVGERGVEGTMDVWREADTEHGWAKYVLPVG